MFGDLADLTVRVTLCFLPVLPPSDPLVISSASTCSSSRTVCSSESDLPVESSTWNMVLDLSLHHKIGGSGVFGDGTEPWDLRNVSILAALDASTLGAGMAGVDTSMSGSCWMASLVVSLWSERRRRGAPSRKEHHRQDHMWPPFPLLDTVVRKVRFCTARWLEPRSQEGCDRLTSRAPVDWPCVTAFLSSASLSLVGTIEPVLIFLVRSAFSFHVRSVFSLEVLLRTHWRLSWLDRASFLRIENAGSTLQRPCGVAECLIKGS